MSEDKEPEMLELLRISISANEKLEELEYDIQIAKIAIEGLTNKLKYKCMAEDIHQTKKKKS